MSSTKIPISGFTFLSALNTNNNRDWFEQNKSTYLTELTYIENFAEALLRTLNTHDVIDTPSGKKSMYRIYRDTRFSKNKTPFKTHWGGHFTRTGKHRRGGYYFHLEPGNSYVLGGFNAPNAQDIKRIRDEIAFDDSALRAVLNNETFLLNFGILRGEQLKTSPKGYDTGHPANDLLRYKQFLLIKKFQDDEVLSGNFIEEVNKAFQNMRPFFDYMSQILNTDINGIEL